MTHEPHSTARLPRRILALVASLTLGGMLLTSTSAPTTAQEPAPAPASNFMYFKLPQGQPVCSGFALNVTNGPFYKRSDCGFADFTLTGATSTAVVKVDLSGPDGAVFTTLTATFRSGTTWRFNLQPAASWPAGEITATVKVGNPGVAAGSSIFGHNQLGADLTVAPAGGGQPHRPGDPLNVSGNIHQLDNMTDLAGPSQTGVGATFSLAIIAPDGTVTTVGTPITAANDGSFNATIPAGTTSGFTGDETTEFELFIVDAAIIATYTDGSTCALAAVNAGLE